MLLTDYTTYAEIRSLLGVSAKELPDDVVALPHWALATEQELRDIVGGSSLVIDEYTTIKALDPGVRTDDQTQFYNVTRLFVMYHAAWQMLQPADGFSPVKITDGKAAVDRLADRFEKLKPAISAGLERLRQRVKDALAVLQPTAPVESTVTRIYTIGIGLGVDPVTGA